MVGWAVHVQESCSRNPDFSYAYNLKCRLCPVRAYANSLSTDENILVYGFCAAKFYPSLSFPLLLYPLFLLPSSSGWYPDSCTSCSWIQDFYARLILRVHFNHGHCTDVQCLSTACYVRYCFTAWNIVYFHIVLFPAAYWRAAEPVLLSRTNGGSLRSTNQIQKHGTETFSWTRDLAHLVKCLLYRHKNLSLIPQTHIKIGKHIDVFSGPRAGEEETTDSWLAGLPGQPIGWPQWLKETVFYKRWTILLMNNIQRSPWPVHKCACIWPHTWSHIQMDTPTWTHTWACTQCTYAHTYTHQKEMFLYWSPNIISNFLPCFKPKI